MSGMKTMLKNNSTQRKPGVEAIDLVGLGEALIQGERAQGKICCTDWAACILLHVPIMHHLRSPGADGQVCRTSDLESVLLRLGLKSCDGHQSSYPDKHSSGEAEIL